MLKVFLDSLRSFFFGILFLIQHHNLHTSFTTELFVDVHDGAPLHVLGLISSRDLRLWPISGAQHAIVRIIFLIDSY